MLRSSSDVQLSNLKMVHALPTGARFEGSSVDRAVMFFFTTVMERRTERIPRSFDLPGMRNVSVTKRSFTSIV